MEKNTFDMVQQQIAIAKETLAELPQADRATCELLRNQLALALDSITVLVEHEAPKPSIHQGS